MAERPTKLGSLFLWTLGVALGLSFLSGTLLWYAQIQREQFMEPPTWQHLWRTIHGLLNPAICLLFGYLWWAHIPLGWKMKANRTTGALLTLDLFVLIITGQGLYYSNARQFWFWSHLALGLLLPLAFVLHWICARNWVATLGSNEKIPQPRIE